MGLDICAYSKLESIGKHTEDMWCDHHISAYAYDSFPLSFRGISILAAEDQFLQGGCYVETLRTEKHDFRAGSYGGYNQWREGLKNMFNPDTEAGQPFYELIWFADNEGTIGPEAATDLLIDFREWEQTYIGLTRGVASNAYHADYDIERYHDWMRAFELGADSGLVCFR